ncbi:MAG TPA: response regulator transcription factor [Allosphingosinicella sp.]
MIGTAAPAFSLARPAAHCEARAKILLVEDDDSTADYIGRALGEAGFAVLRAADGRAGLELALGPDVDAIILDRVVDHVGGIALVKAVRAARIPTPILLLSAISSTDERVSGLNAGSDDYLAKPFAISELLARVEALLRRGGSNSRSEETRLGADGLTIDLLTRTVERDGLEIDLSRREFALLEYLMRHAHETVTRAMLLECVWGLRFDPQTNVIEVHISRLRQKIDRGFDRSLLHTIKGEGYCLGAIDSADRSSSRRC